MDVVESARELSWIGSRLAQPLTEAPGAAVIGTNLQGVVAFWNPAAESLYGWSRDEAFGRDILDLTPAKYTRGQSAQIMTNLQAGQPWAGEILLRRRDGSPVLAFVLDVPVVDLAQDQGAIVGISVAAGARDAIEDQAPALIAAVRRRFGMD